MKMFKELVMCAMLIGYACSNDAETVTISNQSVKKQTEISQLQSKVFALEGTIAQINAFVASDFTDCSEGLPPFETKICQIAQTANAEQQVVYASQLNNMVKVFQTSLYGQNCTDEVTVDCPATGSIVEKINSINISGLEADITQLQTDVSQLQTDVSQLQTDISTLESRLDNFDGTGSSIEVVISGIESDISALDTRVTSIEDTVNNGDIYKTVFLCNNIFNSGPVYEPILITGDDKHIKAYVNTSTQNGMAEISEAGVTGDLYTTTTANTRKCNFKIYDLLASLKVCWDNTDRKASELDIDTACDSANAFANPTSACTCAN